MKKRWGVPGLKKVLVATLAFMSMMTSAQTTAENSIAGEWDGMIASMHLVFTFGQTPQSGLQLKLTSVDQGNAVVPVDSVSFESGKLDVEMKAIGGSYVATLSAAGDSITGTWAQGAMSLPLTLHRPGAQPAVFTLKPRMIGTVPLEPCRTVDGNIEGLCGTVSVWENRELKHGPRRQLLSVDPRDIPDGGLRIRMLLEEASSIAYKRHSTFKRTALGVHSPAVAWS